MELICGHSELCFMLCLINSFRLVSNLLLIEENPHEKDLKKKYEFLCKQAQNFSYKSFVSEKTRLKKIDNCTEDVE